MESKKKTTAENTEKTPEQIAKDKISALIEEGKKKGMLSSKELMDTLEELNLEETNIQRWRNWMANSVNPPEKSFMWEQMTDWYPQLCSGEMTIEQFLFQTQERADMVLGE